jgi:chemotaxis protein CheC
MDMNNFTEMQLDAMKEIGNIGAGNAAASLSMMLGMNVRIRVPSVDVVDFDVLQDMFGGAGKVYVGALSCLGKDVEGTLLVLLSGVAANFFVSKLLGSEQDVMHDFGEMASSVVAEVGNIIAGSYMNAISQFAGLAIEMSPPNAVIDMVGAILNLPAAVFGMTGDKALVMSSEIMVDNRELDGHFILTPTMESFSNIMKAIGL